MEIMKRRSIIGLFLIVAGAMTANAAVISGVVSDSAGAPLKKIYVALKATNTAGTTLSRDTTDSTGAYSVTCDSTTGKYVLRTTDLTVPAAYITQYDTIAPDGTAKTVNIKMVKIRWASVSGIVSDSVAGTPLSGAIVRLGNAKRDTTGTDGKYIFDSASTGSTITASLTGFVTKTVTLAINDSVVTANVALAPIKYSSISGTITDSAAGTAVSGAVVRLGTRRDTTATDGKYAFDSVTTGAASISVTARGYVTKTASITVPDTALTADVKLVAIVYGAVSGTVTDSAAGTAIPGAIITLSSSTTFLMKTDTAGTDGTFSFDSVELGKYSVNASAAKYVAKIDSVVLTDTARKTLDIKLGAAVYFAVSGKVTDSVSGAAIVGALVALRNASGVTLDSVLTDSTGLYTIDSAFTGTRIRVTAAGYLLKRVNLTGATSAAQTINVPVVKTLTSIKTTIGIARHVAVSVVAGRLVLNDFNEAGTIRLVNMKGEQVCEQSFPAGASFGMQLGKTLSAGSYVVRISSKSGVFQKRIAVK